jgi:cell division protein FtsB
VAWSSGIFSWLALALASMYIGPPLWHLSIFNQSNASTSQDTATVNHTAQLKAELAQYRRRNLELELKIQALTPPSAAPATSASSIGQYNQFDHDEMA